MRISSVRIQGFRAIADLSVDFDELTAFVGTGGVGKSTILNALDWFFAGGEREERDLHVPNGGDEERSEGIVVAVTFTDLNKADRSELGRYASADPTTLTRTWSPAEGEKLSGNALVHDGFDQIRDAGDRKREFRNRYVQLYDEQGEAKGYPEPASSADAVAAAMEQWERQNPNDCAPRPADARHLGGFAGTPLLAKRIAYVLVGATTGASETLSGRGSPLDRLLSVIKELGDEERQAIDEVQRSAQEEISDVVAGARGAELLSLSSDLSKRVSEYFPGARIRLQDEISPPKPPQIEVRARVSDRGGHLIDPELQGHGLQRALVIALLHEFSRSTSGADAGDDPEARTLMLAIEEPELYQHPLQARALAATLETLATDQTHSIQVAYSTHSPWFTPPVLFGGLWLCRRDLAGGSQATAVEPAATEQAIAEAGYTGDIAYKVSRALADSLREAIFATAVLLTEGATDAALFGAIGDLQGGLDAEGIAIADCGSKEKMGVAIAILKQLEIPFFAVFDADAKRELPAQAELNRRLLKLCGEEEDDWPARQVRTRAGNFEDKLESDLEELWPAFSEACDEAAQDLGSRKGKDPRVYREAVHRAGEPPEFLVEILDAARGLTT